MVAGAVTQSIGWRRAAVGRGTAWRVLPLVLAPMAVAASLVRPPVAASRMGPIAAAGWGLASGLALYLATRAFVAVAARWRPFRLGVVHGYREAAGVSLATSLTLSLLIIVPAEEIFWRGLVLPRLDDALPAAAAAVLSWLIYVAANLTSGSLPIVAAAIVGGGLWTGLAWWSGGVLAGVASHILWTGLMLAIPPGAGRRAAATT